MAIEGGGVECSSNNYSINGDSTKRLLYLIGCGNGKNREFGIQSVNFSDLMMPSGLVCNERLSLVTFYSAYDVGYLVKSLASRVLPDELSRFLNLLRTFFRANIYDVKHLMRCCESLYGGLDGVAKTLEVDRAVGKCHQAGSDSLLTCHVFQKIKAQPEKYAGLLYGLEVF